MKAALFFEDNQLCHLGENIGEKAIKVSTITTEDDKVVSIKNSEVKKMRTRSKIKEQVNDYDDYDDYEEDDKPSKSSYFVVVLTAIAAGIIIIVVAFIAIMIMKYIDTDGTETQIGKMPNLIQYSYKEVDTHYAEYFDLVVESQEYSNEIPAGAIIKQTPAEGKDYIIGNSTVKVVVSKGPRMVTIPNVYYYKCV